MQVVLLDVSADGAATRRAAAALLVSRMGVGFNRMRVTVVAYANSAHVACTGGMLVPSAGYSNKSSLLECISGIPADAPTSAYQPSTTKALLWTARNVVGATFVNTHVVVIASGSDRETERLQVRSALPCVPRIRLFGNGTYSCMLHNCHGGLCRL